MERHASSSNFGPLSPSRGVGLGVWNWLLAALPIAKLTCPPAISQQPRGRLSHDQAYLLPGQESPVEQLPSDVLNSGLNGFLPQQLITSEKARCQASLEARSAVDALKQSVDGWVGTGPPGVALFALRAVAAAPLQKCSVETILQITRGAIDVPTECALLA